MKIAVVSDLQVIDLKLIVVLRMFLENTLGGHTFAISFFYTLLNGDKN